jgi:glycerol-3-phosphate dehydrogenase
VSIGTSIPREAGRVDQGAFDVVVVGAGVQGVFCALEATHRGLRTLIVDAGDFGAATSFNSLRTLHGGLRYLQSLDFARARSSYAQQQWWLEHFPELVERRACLMPIHARRLRGHTAFRIARLLAHLSGMRGPSKDDRLATPAVELLTAAELHRRLPNYPRCGLRGAALWHEAFMPESSRVLIECLRWAIAGGATALNYAELVEARPAASNRVQLVLSDRDTGATVSLIAGAIINAGGARVEEVARRLGARSRTLLVPTLAWNLLLDARLPGPDCIALTPPRRGGQTYFLQPFHGRTLAGTGHADMHGPADSIMPSQAQIDGMRRELDSAWPAARLGAASVVRVLAGILPGVRPGSPRLANRPRIVRDSAVGGIPLVHVVGVKFTEAPVVAARALDRLGLGARRSGTARPPSGAGWNLAEGDETATPETLLDLATSESVVYLEDLIERRTNAWCVESAAARVEQLLGGKLARRGPRARPAPGPASGERIGK